MCLNLLSQSDTVCYLQEFHRFSDTIRPARPLCASSSQPPNMQIPTLASIFLSSIIAVKCIPSAYPDTIWVKRDALSQLLDRRIASPDPAKAGAVLVAARDLSGIMATEVIRARDEESAVAIAAPDGTESIEGTDGTDQIQLCYFFHKYYNQNY